MRVTCWNCFKSYFCVVRSEQEYYIHKITCDLKQFQHVKHNLVETGSVIILFRIWPQGEMD